MFKCKDCFFKAYSLVPITRHGSFAFELSIITDFSYLSLALVFSPLQFVFTDPYGAAHFFPGYHQYGNPADSFADVRARYSSPNINQQNLTSEHDGSVTSYKR